MKRVAASLLLLALVGCGRDAPTLAPVKTTLTTAPQTIGTTPTTSALIAADSPTPAAGTCANAPADGAADIVLNPDVPSPRCVIVHSLNQIKVTNNTDAVQTVDTGYDTATLQPHESHLFAQHVGDFWADGVHRLKTSLYAGSGPEVWLQ